MFLQMIGTGESIPTHICILHNLMGSEDPEWVIDETGSEPMALRPEFNYEHIISMQRDRLASMRPKIVHTEFCDFRRSKTGYTGRNTTQAADIPKTVPAVGNILDRRFGGRMMKLVPWDGLSALPIVCDKNRVIAIGAPQPPVQDWNDTHQRASVKIFDVRRTCAFGENRRGKFSSVNFGFSFGNGHLNPRNRCYNDPRHRVAIESLRADPDIQVLAGAASGE